MRMLQKDSPPEGQVEGEGLVAINPHQRKDRGSQAQNDSAGYGRGVQCFGVAYQRQQAGHCQHNDDEPAHCEMPAWHEV